MPGPTFLDGQRVTLRPVERDDTAFLQRGWTDPDIRVPIGMRHPQNQAQVEGRIEEWIESDDSLTLFVCLDDDPIGEVTVRDLDRTRPELAYWIVLEHHGQGYGSEAVSLVIDYIFESFEKRGVMAHCFDTNEGSQALLESLGFTEEGRLREHRFVEGEYVDAVIYGLLREEWLDE